MYSTKIISEGGLDSTDWAQWGLYKKRPMADILPVLSPASLLIRDLLHNRKVQCVILKFNLVFSSFFFLAFSKEKKDFRIARKTKRI